jgi:hypothetical protein
MTPVKAPTPLCADAVPGQEAAATNANAARDDFGMLTLLRSLGDQLATNLRMLTITRLIFEWTAIPGTLGAPNALHTKPSRSPVAAPFSRYHKRHSQARGEPECSAHTAV